MKAVHVLFLASGALLALVLGPEAVFALPTMEELQLVFQRRQMTASRLYNDSALVASWRSSLLPNGTWPDVDYTAGCEARRAEWPAQDHVIRIGYLVSGFYQNQADADLLSKINLAMNFWFDNEYPHEDCINGGGRPELECPCGTPGLWNTNWWYAMIGLPIKLGDACIMLDSHLTPTQRSNCTAHTQRAYVRINGDPNGSLHNHTGANRLDIASSGVAYAVLTGDLEVLDDAFFQFHDTCQFIRGNLDGTKVDGSFLYHNAQLYSGNYGMHFINQMLAAMMHTFGTSLEIPQSSKDVVLALIEGSEWMIYFKGDGGPEDEGYLNWQYASSGRKIAWKYEDLHGINISLSYMIDGTQGWDAHDRFVAVSERLQRRRTGSANPGPLIGTKHFWVADYLVHRGQNYVVNLKMFSPRVVNTECINDENHLGFHLSDGAIFSYIRGTEYYNVFGAWDWYLVPGTTVNYGATPLVCGQSRFHGKEAFVGGVSYGNAGIAVMNYTNPMTESLRWAKTFFFFPGAYVVQYVGDFVVDPDSSAPIVTNLDQRQLGSGAVYVDGAVLDSTQARVTAQSIYHDRVGYSFQAPVTVDINTTERPSNWSAIGVSVGFDPETLFSATVIHDGVREGETYIAYLDVDQAAFEQLAKQSRSGLDSESESGIKILGSKSSRKDSRSRAYPEVRGATYGSSAGTGDRIIALAFWDPTNYSTGETDITAVSVDIPCVVLLTRKPGGAGAGWTVSVADPSQRATRLNLSVTVGFVGVNFQLDLPTGDFAGSPVSLDLT